MGTTIQSRRISESSLREAGEVVRSGGVIAFPTETFYGLGVDPFNVPAVQRLCDLKGRPPRTRPVLVLMGDVDDWTRPGPCVDLVASQRARGADATIVLYHGAYHYFDVEGQARTELTDVANDNRPNSCCGATVGYDPEAAADAFRRVAVFFGRYLAPR